MIPCIAVHKSRRVLFDAEAWPPTRAEIISMLALIVHTPRAALNRTTAVWITAAETGIVAVCSVAAAAPLHIHIWRSSRAKA